MLFNNYDMCPSKANGEDHRKQRNIERRNAQYALVHILVLLLSELQLDRLDPTVYVGGVNWKRKVYGQTDGRTTNALRLYVPFIKLY